MQEPLNIVKMKMWYVKVGDAPEELVGSKEKEFYVSVFKECCRVREIELPGSSNSPTISGDETFTYNQG
jgi:hypothetical protein